MNDFIEDYLLEKAASNSASLDNIARRKVINLSIDDFELALKDITDNEATYDSIFDNATFAKMQTLHETYGAKFSCFCFSNNTFDISTTTTKFKNEFAGNSNWLKFGFHGKDSATYYNVDTLANFKIEYEKVINAITAFAGASSLCKAIRLHGFYATTDILAELATTYGIKGLFAADDERVSYDFTVAESHRVNVDNVFHKNSLNYFKTTPRMDNDNATTALAKMNTMYKKNIISVFLHEINLIAFVAGITTACAWANLNNYQFDFFDDLPDMTYLAQNILPISAPYTFGSGWSIRSGSAFSVKINGKHVHIQGQLIKNADIPANDPCLQLGIGVMPPCNLIVPVVCLPDTGSVAQNIVGIIQTTGSITVGYRDLVAAAGNRVISISASFYID